MGARRYDVAERVSTQEKGKKPQQILAAALLTVCKRPGTTNGISRGKCILMAEYLNGLRTIFLDVRRLP
jgi:hypothetical protein